ncbi:MAG: polyprenyl synthetase family protein [Rubrivivax sp.]|nr:polyprenyl synthetase family protein [Pyrinomonadaceae bacterium]
MTEHLDSFIARERCGIEGALRERLPLSSLPAARRLNEALEYAVFPGGKRLRPILTLLASDLVSLPREHGLTVACAVEFLHSSSLILDDLPGMDDADLRRNRRTLHLVFGEGVATLAAVALLNQSYALLAHAARACGQPGAVEALVSEATHCVGADGMIGGQVIDLETRAGCADPDSLAGRDLKTVALMRLMMTTGALACGADEPETRALAEFGECFGRAYQICDDLLDDTCGIEPTGKTTAQDARHLRATAVTAFGKQDARRLALRLIEGATARLIEQFGERAEVRLLADTAYLVVGRVKDYAPTGSAQIPAAALGGRASA